MTVINYKESGEKGDVIIKAECVTFYKGRLHVWKKNGSCKILPFHRTSILES